jgi:hypothetical protein
LEGGPPGFPQGSSCLVVLWILSRSSTSHTRLLRSAAPAFHPVILLASKSFYDSPQPRITEVTRFGLFRFRSPLLAESRLISLPGATEMFQFAPFPPACYVFTCGSSGIHPDGVPPFGHLRIIGYLLLPAAFRSLSRPSSAIGAKAFTLRS